jgi:transcriptional antiterminator RfaH
MPILSEEVSVYPETLLEGPETGRCDRRWWVFHTRARQEKAVARELLGYHVPFYLPLVRKTWIRRGRRVSSYVPMFSGYVFVYASEEERVRSLATNRVCRVLTVHDPIRLLHDLQQIRHLIGTNLVLTIERRLARGDRVRVRSGPLTGLEGTVLTRSGETRLVISVDFLQQGASVEIDDSMLERME